MRGDIKTVRLLINHRADVNAKEYGKNLVIETFTYLYIELITKLS